MSIGVEPQMVVKKKTPDPKKAKPMKVEPKKIETKKIEIKKVSAVKPAVKPVPKSKK